MSPRSRILSFAAASAAAWAVSAETPIDRHALVTRNNPVVRSVDYDAPLTVGNGGFAFTVDITGLQTFPAEYQRNGVPLETQARWAWVSDENPEGYTLDDASRPFTQADGRVVRYATAQSTPAGDWLRKNPRAHPLGVIGLVFDKADGTPLSPADIQDPDQTLDLWSGVITSRFKLEGVPVRVVTACTPREDSIEIVIDSELVANGRLRPALTFPRGHDLSVKNTPAYDWSRPESHDSKQVSPEQVVRTVAGFNYAVLCTSALEPDGEHRFLITGEPGSKVSNFVVHFARAPQESPLRSGMIIEESEALWPMFWLSGAAIDLSGSTDPRAHELERRIVLSQYLMAVQMAGDVPPQESGLTCNTWYGKHHTEMIWWHAAHFALWGRGELLAKNIEWYQSQLPAARELAASRGLQGARWAKMTGPQMRESPGGNPLIVWNQPHMVYLCELLYRNSPDSENLDRYRDLVLESADCMASMLFLDPKRGEYVLGPPLWIAQEIHDQATSQNPSFELAYWRWGLGVAQQWRERLGMERDPRWDDILARLPALPEKHGRYVALESHPDTWDNIDSRHDHPQMLMPLGFLPGGPDVDRATMNRTLDGVLEQWDWETKIWGWDYPMIAMTAARLGRGEDAVAMLVRDGPNNAYLPNGHVPQRSDVALDRNAPPGVPRREIAAYLPANGALLAAVALMAGGWEGSGEPHPGFPKDGSWVVRSEGFRRSP